MKSVLILESKKTICKNIRFNINYEVKHKSFQNLK